MTLVAEVLISALIVIGAVFTLLGSYGLVKLDNLMSRLHAPTKASTLGVGSILTASMFYAFLWEDGSVHEVLITTFLFFTAPVSAMFLSKLAIHRNRTTQEPPAPPVDRCWATRDIGD